MVYTPQTWSDNSPSTPLSAARLQHIEDGIESVDLAVDEKVAKGSIVLNVKDYGVEAGEDADVTANTAAIQAVFDAITPGTTVLFPAGEYYHDHLTISSKSDFAISGHGAKLKAATGTVQYLAVDTCTDFTISGLTSMSSIDPEDLEAQNYPTRAFSIQTCLRFLITGCTARDGEGVGFYFRNSEDGRVISNYVENSQKDGIHFTNKCKRMVVQGNIVHNSGDDGIAIVSYQTDGGQCETFSITGNTVYQPLSAGIANHGSKNITISGNTVLDTQGAGIFVDYQATYNTYGPSNTTISGNTVINANTYERLTNYAGIAVLSGSANYTVTGTTITGNTVDGSYWHGIMIGSGTTGVYGVNCSGNTIRNSGGNGIILQAVTNAKVKGNVVNTSVSSGIWCTDALGLITIQDNDFIDPCTNVANTIGLNLAMTGITHGVITGNSLYDTIGHATTPLSVTNIGPCLLYGNNVGGNTTGASASPDPFVGPRNVLLAGALPSNGLGSGVGVVGIRNANTVPTTNPGSGFVLYSEGGSPVIRDSGGSITRVGGSLRTVTADYTVLQADRTILINGSGLTITLPSAVVVGAGSEYRVKNVHSSNTATLAAVSGDFDGTATIVLQPLDAYILISDGTNWRVF